MNDRTIIPATDAECRARLLENDLRELKSWLASDPRGGLPYRLLERLDKLIMAAEQKRINSRPPIGNIDGGHQ